MAHLHSNWFYGDISPQAADQLIYKSRQLGNGTFLVRESLTHPGDYALVYLYDERAHRALIRTERHYGVNVFYMTRSQLFNSLTEIVEHYRKTPLKTPHFDVLLTRPCPPVDGDAVGDFSSE
uniref:SH2 domain-containing protein n=1 Tax=Steinernema glaseri TaxID=37863 RepID=A0A1I7ZWV4_9BILA